MAKKVHVDDRTVIEAILTAPKYGWTLLDAAKSCNMEKATFYQRKNTLLKAAVERGQTKIVEAIENAFRDGRGAPKKNVGQTLDLFGSMLDELDADNDSEDETEGEMTV